MSAKTVQASFPSELERTVASALLLLSKSDDSSSPESLESTRFSASEWSGGSTPTTEVCIDEDFARDRQLTVVAFWSGFDDLMLKIVRKKRSRAICISSGKKPKTDTPGPTLAPASSENISEITTIEAEASSCLSSTSSAHSINSETNADGDKPRKPEIQGHMGNRAASILRVLSNGSASEVKIRKLLGDSPSTSKALRMLLKLQKVKRYGAGGRSDPFIYTIAN
ncbi:hypothetical protein CASFOL_032567 [Castilleja foliolosa]|uniref:HTH three-helical bundle domain-containing protein n=1 Tax=Castilleja foliolosa TaxID=1961234 RepID=A0ABD3C1W6_9LAMI